MDTTDVAEPHLRVPKMAELVSDRLRRQIIRGELSTGDALPSETALMARLGVSRPTLREAFRVLESEGLITIRRGAHGGARVQSPNGEIAGRYAGLLLEFRRTTLADVYNAPDPRRTVMRGPVGGALHAGKPRATPQGGRA
jgi:DNA-binding FadR family transcriptional regulator